MTEAARGVTTGGNSGLCHHRTAPQRVELSRASLRCHHLCCQTCSVAVSAGRTRDQITRRAPVQHSPGEDPSWSMDKLSLAVLFDHSTSLKPPPHSEPSAPALRSRSLPHATADLRWVAALVCITRTVATFRRLLSRCHREWEACECRDRRRSAVVHGPHTSTAMQHQQNGGERGRLSSCASCVCLHRTVGVVCCVALQLSQWLSDRV